MGTDKNLEGKLALLTTTINKKSKAIEKMRNKINTFQMEIRSLEDARSLILQQLNKKETSLAPVVYKCVTCKNEKKCFEVYYFSMNLHTKFCPCCKKITFHTRSMPVEEKDLFYQRQILFNNN